MTNLPDPDSYRLPPRTNEPYDDPTGPQLIEAVRRYLADDLMPRSSGADRWTLRIAANALAIAGREAELGERHIAAHRERLQVLGAGDDRSLSALLRGGQLDDRMSEALELIAATVADKLAVSNPAYGARAADGSM